MEHCEFLTVLLHDDKIETSFIVCAVLSSSLPRSILHLKVLILWVNIKSGAFLVAQWSRILLPRQWTWVRSLVQRIPYAAERLGLCAKATEPVFYSPGSSMTEAHVRRACAPQRERPPQWEAYTLRLEGPRLATTRENTLAVMKT